MTLAPLTRNLLIGAGVVGAAGLATAVFLTERSNRREEADQQQAARDAKLSPAEVATRAITAFDEGTFDLLSIDGYGATANTQAKDGVLTLGQEDTTSRNSARTGLFPETIDLEEGQVQSARAMLLAADSNDDGNVTHAELSAAITPYAGADGVLDEADRRRALVDGGLGEPVSYADMPKIEREDAVVRAGDVVDWMTDHGYSSSDPDGFLSATFPDLDAFTLDDEGSRAFRIADHGTATGTRAYGHGVVTGPITSTIPTLTQLEREHGNGNGLLSERELGRWIATKGRIDNQPFGYVDLAKTRGIGDRIERERLGRIDVTTMSGKLYYDTTVPQASIDAHYGGNLTKWIEEHTHVGAYKGEVQWQPDPQSGEPLTPTE